MRKNKKAQSPDRERRLAPLMSAFLGACLFMTVFSGCAFTNRDNTPLLNQVEKHLWPEDTAMRVVVFPLVFPTGLAAVLVDAFVVHPATVIGDCAKDTGDALWTNWDWKNHYVTECATLPWRAILTPVFFTGDFLARAMFDIPRRGAEEREIIPPEREADFEEYRKDRAKLDRIEAQQRVREGLEEARTNFKSGHYPEALQRIGSIYRDVKGHEYIKYLSPEHRIAFTSEVALMILDAISRSGRFDLMPARPWPDDVKFHGKAVEDRLKSMQASEDPLARWTAFLFRMHYRISDDAWYERVREALSDPSAVLRHIALNWAARNLTDAELRYLAPQLKKMAEEDPDPLNRAYAGQMIAWMK